MVAKLVTVTEDQAGQRIDNFLMRHFRSLPKSRLYRAIRKGEVRVNKGRVKSDYRVKARDQVRLPPLQVDEDAGETFVPTAALMERMESRILLEDSDLLIIDKPSKIPVHGGTGLSWGLIEVLRKMRPHAKLMELVHRLDRDTSGCLVIAKKRKVLVTLHDLLARRQVKKTYLALVKGAWEGRTKTVDAPLLKNQLQSGERVVRVDSDGKPSRTLFKPIKRFANATLVEAQPITGRTHQIRVHARHLGHPIAGDEKYGDDAFNKAMRAKGLRRLFLHSASISFLLSEETGRQGVCALLDDELIKLLDKMQ